MGEPLELSQKPANRKRLLERPVITDEQVVLFFDRLESGSTVTDAASSAGFTRRTAHRLLASYEAKVDGAVKVLAIKAYKAAEDWIRASEVAADKGDHKPAMQLLQTVGAVQVIGEGSNTGITINIGTPDTPIRIPQQIDTVSPTDK